MLSLADQKILTFIVSLFASFDREMRKQVWVWYASQEAEQTNYRKLQSLKYRLDIDGNASVAYMANID